MYFNIPIKHSHINYEYIIQKLEELNDDAIRFNISSALIYSNKKILTKLKKIFNTKVEEYNKGVDKYIYNNLK